MSIFGKWAEREVQRLAPGEPVWIFGAGSFGRAVARACASQGVEVRGFVQTQPTAACVDGLPVCTWGDLKSADRVEALLISVFNRDSPIGSLVRLASEAVYQRMVLLCDLHAQFGIELGWRYWLADSDLLRRHATNLERCFSLLSDDKSRACLKRLVDFRLGLNMDYSEFTHDVEGAEESASRGAKRAISVHRPVLALSCYHNLQSLWALPGLICQLAANYCFYLRRHMFNSFDLVLYAIPDEIH